jgi:hypothetical protein
MVIIRDNLMSTLATILLEADLTGSSKLSRYLHIASFLCHQRSPSLLLVRPSNGQIRISETRDEALPETKTTAHPC